MNRARNRNILIFLIVSLVFFIALDAAAFIGKLRVSPWIALLIVFGLSVMLFLRGRGLGFPLLSALLIIPLLLSFTAILFFKENLVTIFHDLPGWINRMPFYGWFLIACFILACFRILGIKSSRLSTIKVSFFSKCFSILKRLILYAVLGSLMAFIAAWLWTKIVAVFEPSVIQKMPIPDLHFSNLIGANWFWIASMAMAAILAIYDMVQSHKSHQWDVFISYKSKNVDIARAIANRLMASGIKAWFAEYRILLVDREHFQDSIDLGIRTSKYGIALTNDEYAGSVFCHKEMVQLLAYCGAKNIFEIMIPEEPLTHQKYEQLRDSNHFRFNNNLEEILESISRKTGWKIVPALSQKPYYAVNTFNGKCLDEPYSINVSGWDLVERSFHGGGPCYQIKIDGNLIMWNLQYGEEISPTAYESRSNRANQNDRVLYNSMIDYANEYFSQYQSDYRIKGVHLLFMNGSSHFVVTYTNWEIWKRRYSIILAHPVTNRIAEFVFTFEFKGTFSEYCLASGKMDDLVRSLNWGGEAGSSPINRVESQPAKPSVEKDRISRLIEDQPMANKLYNDGISFAKQGKLTDAIAAWKHALDFTTLVELRGAILYNLGRAFEKQGGDEAAINYYRESAEVNPAQYNALCNAGHILLEQNRSKEALELLLKAVEANPRDPVTIQNLILCYENLGEEKQVDEWMQRLDSL
jgi:tetratricopeptide (TPR) repeat protein